MGYWEALLCNEEDLQLVLYVKMLGQDRGWLYIVFYIINKGKIFVWNNYVFKVVEVIMFDIDMGEVNQCIWDCMIKIYNWRLV